jgi:hypothetical protein
MAFKGFLKLKACKFLNRSWLFSIRVYGDIVFDSPTILKKTAEFTICGLLFEFVYWYKINWKED